MKAQILETHSSVEQKPLKFRDMDIPTPEKNEILVNVSTCGVCHTELDEIEGRLICKSPVILGHEIIGIVEDTGTEVTKFRRGDRVGIAWINYSCGKCKICSSGKENLCVQFRGTGCDADGGYAQYTKISQDFAYLIPDIFTDSQAAPLLCAGAIGLRDLRLSGIKPGEILGLFGFGASAHMVIQVAKYWNCKVFVITRSEAHRNLAIELGADWAGSSEQKPPQKVNYAIDFTPVGETIPIALNLLEKGGVLVIAVIRKRTLIPALDYTQFLWDERVIKSVSNITRKDVSDFLKIAAEIKIKPEIHELKLEEANEVLVMLKQGKISGAAVLKM